MKTSEGDIKQISLESTNYDTLFGDFCNALKIEKVGPNFHPCPSLPSIATDDRKQCQCLIIL